jgi:hypothetical protein
MKPGNVKTNEHDTRESWLRAATDELRNYLESCSLTVPNNIRFAIAFPSTGRRGARIGECWHSSTSADGHFEIIIRADVADPVEVLGVLVHELVHAGLPPDAGHGKPYRADSGGSRPPGPGGGRARERAGAYRGNCSMNGWQSWPKLSARCRMPG